MSTSNNTTWALQRDAIVNAAYRKVGFLAQDQTLEATPLAIGVEALNGVVALLVTNGMPLWKRTTSTVALSATSQVYTVASAEKISQVVLVNSNGSQYELIEKSLYDFNRLPQTTANPATPVHYYAQKTLTGYTVSIWPLVADTTSIAQMTIKIVYQKQFDGFFSATDDLDFPSFWTQPVIYQLAAALAPETGLPLADRQMLGKEADMFTKMASDYGDEDGSFFMQVDYLGHKRGGRY